MKKDYFILFILIFYLFFQFSTLDYGFKINNFSYFKNTSINETFIKDFTEKKKIKNKENVKNENNKWEYRYKLYSVNADEMIPIMSLSKINIVKKEFDPQVYKYGGAFIYPLGFYYYFLTKINFLENINSQSLISNENLIDDIYFNGRLFILLSFIFSAFVLYKCLNLITKKKFSLLLTTIYLFVPSSIMYSQIIKPNWYALLWFNIAIYFILKYFIKKNNKKNLLIASIFFGLTMGSSILYAPAIFLIFVLIFNYSKKNTNNYFFFIIFATLSIFFITNPYILLNLGNFINESSGEYTWVLKGIKLNNIIPFFYNSFIQGFGFIITLSLIYYLLKKPKKKFERNVSLFIFLLILFGAIISSFEIWHIQFRYIPYILPITLIFLGYYIKNEKFLILILIGTFLQSLPLKLAYYDENNLNYSTRINSANWINENIIKKNKSICKKEFSPFDFPPINFNKVLIKKKCNYEIHVLRQPKKINIYKQRRLVKKFEPRYQFSYIPLVFSHINPLIIILENSYE